MTYDKVSCLGSCVGCTQRIQTQYPHPTKPLPLLLIRTCFQLDWTHSKAVPGVLSHLAVRKAVGGTNGKQKHQLLPTRLPFSSHTGFFGEKQSPQSPFPNLQCPLAASLGAQIEHVDRAPPNSKGLISAPGVTQSDSEAGWTSRWLYNWES